MTGTFRKLTTPPYQQQQQQIAQNQQQASQQLQNLGIQFETPFLTGTLPPDQQAAVDLARQNADAAAQSRFASLNLGDSTMAASALGYDQLQARALAADIEKAMAAIGAQDVSTAQGYLSGAAGTYNNLATQQSEADKLLNSAISGFTGALGRGAAIPGLGGGAGGTNNPTALGPAGAGSGDAVAAADVGALGDTAATGAGIGTAAAGTDLTASDAAALFALV